MRTCKIEKPTYTLNTHHLDKFLALVLANCLCTVTKNKKFPMKSINNHFTTKTKHNT